MTKTSLIIATRESPLALQQAESIKLLLLQHHPHLQVHLFGMTTQGDKHVDVTLTEMGGKGLFVKELEEALLDGRADMAVHSMKDVPMELPAKLCLPVMSKRLDPRDVFVSNRYASFAALPAGARMGSSSLRRQAQLRALRHDIVWQNLRGNIQTRLNRLDKEEYDAIVLAEAGLNRMQLTSRIRSYFSIEEILPAAGQGALGMECREEDAGIKALIAPLNDMATNVCVTAERALCRRLGGGCKVPVAAYAEINSDGMLILKGLVASVDGTHLLRAMKTGDVVDAEKIGLQVAEMLLQQGAENILKEFL